MKHDFVLDENILYFAVKGMDENNNPDLSSAELVILIAKNCHTITTTPELLDRYERHLQGLKGTRTVVITPDFLRQLFHNSAKARTEYGRPPDPPARAMPPAEDLHVVQAGLLYRSVIVTGDTELRDYVNSTAALHLTAVSPHEALALAGET